MKMRRLSGVNGKLRELKQLIRVVPPNKQPSVPGQHDQRYGGFFIKIKGV